MSQPGILALDDDPTMRALFAIAFRNLPVVFRAAEDGAQAIGMIAEAPPDLLLADFNINGLNGVEVMEKVLRETSRTIPIVIVSAQCSRQLEPYVHSGRCLGYVLKPISLQTFGAQCLRYLDVDVAGPPLVQPDGAGLVFLRAAVSKAKDLSNRVDRDLLADGLLVSVAHQWAGASGIACLPDVETQARALEKLAKNRNFEEIARIRCLLEKVKQSFEDALNAYEFDSERAGS